MMMEFWVVSFSGYHGIMGVVNEVWGMKGADG